MRWIGSDRIGSDWIGLDQITEMEAVLHSRNGEAKELKVSGLACPGGLIRFHSAVMLVSNLRVFRVPVHAHHGQHAWERRRCVVWRRRTLAIHSSLDVESCLSGRPTPCPSWPRACLGKEAFASGKFVAFARPAGWVTNCCRSVEQSSKHVHTMTHVLAHTPCFRPNGTSSRRRGKSWSRS